MVTPDYRLSPKVKYPAYVDDAAAAFAWTVKHIAGHGGDPRKVFIGGHSAGATLALLVGMDPNRLKPPGLTLGSVAGIAQVSGQVLTHFTIREERGQPRYAITCDDAGERSFTYWRNDSAAKRLASDPKRLEAALDEADIAYWSGITLATTSQN